MNESIKYWDEKIVASHIGTELKWLFDYIEKKEIKVISFVDIGGNVGKFFDEISKKYEVENCAIVEPSKGLYNYMSNKYEGYKNVFLYNFGISDVEGEFLFDDSGIDYWSKRNPDNTINLGLSKINNSHGDTKFITIDHFLSEVLPFDFNKLSFIKIDTENRDVQILKGLKDFLLRNNIRPLILFESNYHNDMTDEQAQTILDELCTLCDYYSLDIKIPGDKCLTPKF